MNYVSAVTVALLLVVGASASGSCNPNPRVRDPRPLCGGILSGYKNYGDVTNCSYIDIAQPAGTITRAVAFDGCKDRANGCLNGVPQSAFRMDGGYLYWTSGTGLNIWQSDDATAESIVWAPMPDFYNYTVKIQWAANAGLYLFTTSSLVFYPGYDNLNASADLRSPLPVAGTPVEITSSLSLSALTLIAGGPFDSVLYSIDGKTVTTYNVTNPLMPSFSYATVQSLDDITDLSVYSPDGTQESNLLLVTQSYTSLHLLDPNTGVSKFLMDLPVPNGAAPSNAINGDTYFYADSSSLYTILISTATVDAQNPFDGTTLQGFFQFHP